MAFIPKADGGLRPIALLAAVALLVGLFGSRLRQSGVAAADEHPARPVKGVRASLSSKPGASGYQVRVPAVAGQVADLAVSCAAGPALRRVLLA
eukprot:2575917-Pyramimonas_sp.AAC.1